MDINSLIEQYHAGDNAVAEIGEWFAQVINLGNQAKDNDDYATANQCSALALAAYFALPSEMRAGCNRGPHPARIEIETSDSYGASLDDGYYDLVDVVTEWPVPGVRKWTESRLVIPAPMLAALSLIAAYKAGMTVPRLEHDRPEADYDYAVRAEHAERYDQLAERAGQVVRVMALFILRYSGPVGVAETDTIGDEDQSAPRALV